MKLKVYYKWMYLESSGLVKEPDPEGPHYNLEYLNNYGNGYESKEEAFEDLIYFKKRYPFVQGHSLMLVELYEIREETE